MAWFEWTVADADTALGFVVNQTMFHATREQHVEGILEQGLLTGAPADGVLSSPAGEDHNDEFYGMRPVYLLLGPAISCSYQWERWPIEDDEDEDEEPVLLEVDATGLTLLPDLATLEIPHYVWVRPEGIAWWRRDSFWKLEVDPARVPPAFAPFTDSRGIVPYPTLATSAARIAVEFTKTAAVLADIPGSRIRRYAGPVRRYELAPAGETNPQRTPRP